MSRFPGIESVYRGVEAVKAFVPSWRYGWEIWRFGEEDFLDAGDQVVTLVHGPLPSRGNRPVMAGVWRLRDGKVTRFTWYQDAFEALRAAGVRR